MSEVLRKALEDIIGAGYQVSKEGFEFLRSLGDDILLRDLVDYSINRANVIPEETFVLNDEFFRTLLDEMNYVKKPKEKITGKGGNKALAREYDAEVEVIKDPTDEITAGGGVKDFLEYFRDRYRRIERIFKKRIDTKDVTPIREALKSPLKSKAKIMGIIRDKRTSRNRVFIELEDIESSATVLISLKNGQMQEAPSLLEDQIVCLDVLKYREDLFIADNFFCPDIPEKEPNNSEIPLCAALISDIHVGSKVFLKEVFGKFLKWLNMDHGSPDLRTLAGRVKYVIIAGDLIDGIGIYPEQEEELEIFDLEKQYEIAADLLSTIPDYIEVIIIPGNHDAVRKSLPQPAIPRKYAEALVDMGRFRLLGNPSRISLHGVEVLLSHGKALDDVLTQVSGLGFNTPVKGMELLLKARHLAPIYGATTPIAPCGRDWMVIESPPDILHMGHIHIYEYRKYKGVTLINSGAWQGQTPFQERMSLTPTPGIAPIIDLQSLQVVPLDFNLL